MRYSHPNNNDSRNQQKQLKTSDSRSSSSLSHSYRPQLMNDATAAKSPPSSDSFHPCDVLLQSKETAGSHPGNHNLKRLIHLNIEMYGAAKTGTEQRDIVESILGSIRQDGGRFLKFVWPDGKWQEMPFPEADWIVRTALQASNENRRSTTRDAVTRSVPGSARRPAHHRPRVLPPRTPRHPAEEFLRAPREGSPLAHDYPRRSFPTEAYERNPRRVIPPLSRFTSGLRRESKHSEASPPPTLLRDLPSPRPTRKGRGPYSPKDAPILRISLDGDENIGRKNQAYHPDSLYYAQEPSTPKSSNRRSSQKATIENPTRKSPSPPALRVSPVTTHRKRVRESDSHKESSADLLPPSRRPRRDDSISHSANHGKRTLPPKTPFRLPPYHPRRYPNHYLTDNGEAKERDPHPREHPGFHQVRTSSTSTPRRDGEPEGGSSANYSPHTVERTAHVVTPDTTIGKAVIRTSKHSLNRALEAWSPPKEAL